MRRLLWGFLLAVSCFSQNWQELTPSSGTLPFNNNWQQPRYDPVTKSLLVNLANNGSSIYSNTLTAYHIPTNTLHTLWTSGSTGEEYCTALSNTNTGPRDSHPVGNSWVDTKRNRLYYFPGVCQSLVTTDIYWRPLSLTTQSWTRVSLVGKPDVCGANWPFPCSARFTAAAYDPEDDIAVIFGLDEWDQKHDTTVFCASDTGSLTTQQQAGGCATPNGFTGITTANVPAGIDKFASLIYIGNHKILAFGSEPAATVQVWEYDTRAKNWTQHSTTGGPPQQTLSLVHHMMPVAYVPALGKVFYHSSNGSTTEDWEFNVDTNAWTSLGNIGGHTGGS